MFDILLNKFIALLRIIKSKFFRNYTRLRRIEKEALVMRKIAASLLVLLIIADCASADIKLPKIFGDNMVFQQGMKLPVWGWADPGEKVNVRFEGNYAETVTGEDGRWKLYIGPLTAGGPFKFKIEGNNSILLQNVLVGEVWVCSGQSNMAMDVGSSMNSQTEIAAADFPQIRFFQIKPAKAKEPQEDVFPVDNEQSWLNKWEVCSPNTVAHFSGLGYFFARELWEKSEVAIGIINASWGGTTAEAWTPADTLSNDERLKPILQNWPDYNNDEAWLEAEYAEFVDEVKKAKEEGREAPLYFNQPSGLYNAILSPVIPFGIRGVAWYQGESNAYRAYQYQKLFPALIQKWRNNWGQGDFPFLFVQLANYQFEPQVFPELREAQTMALEVKGTAMVVTIDIGDPKDIHPKNKQEVGRRLALAAQKVAYGEELIYSGPLYRSMTIEGNKCILSFDHIGDGLIGRGTKLLTGFEIAGKDKKFVEAQAVIKKDRVIVWNTKVPFPVAIRYSWSNNPSGNLYNSLKKQVYLPASPFRTDNWQGITYNRE